MYVERKVIESVEYVIKCSNEERRDIIDSLEAMSEDEPGDSNRYSELAFKLKDANISEHW